MTSGSVCFPSSRWACRWPSTVYPGPEPPCGDRVGCAPQTLTANKGRPGTALPPGLRPELFQNPPRGRARRSPSTCRLPAEGEARTPTTLQSSAWPWTTRSALSSPWPEGPAPHPASNVLRGPETGGPAHRPESSAALADPTSTPLLGIPAARAVFRGRRRPSSEGAGRTASRGPAGRCPQKGGDGTTGLSLRDPCRLCDVK